MDEIVWSSESLQLIASALRDATNEMEAEIGLLRHCRREEPQALTDHYGTLLDDILEQTDRAIRKLTDASERASELARAVQFTDALFEETERDIRRLYENAAGLAETDAEALPGHWEAPARVAVARGLAGRTVTVPEWLDSAAEQFFRGALS